MSAKADGQHERGRTEIRSPIEISAAADEPLYRQLRKALEHQIMSGVFNLDTPLPSSRALAREIGVSRNTVNAAIQELVAGGLVEARSRSGHFVNRELVEGETELTEPVQDRTGSIDWAAKVRMGADAALPEIVKPKDWRSRPYPFVAGQIDPGEFPRLAWAKALRTAMEREHLWHSVRDAVDEDDPMLVDMLCQRILPARGIHVGAENVLITAGSQQGLDLLAQMLVHPGMRVGVEDPGYPDAKHSFARMGGNLEGIPVDRRGMVIPDILPDLLYVTPSHHCPSNVTLDSARRRHLLAQTRTADSLIIEDDYDSEFRYRGKPTPALKAISGSDHVIYLGSFSKFLAPGLRLGYIVADSGLIRRLRTHRRYSIRHVSGHTQRAMGLLIESGQYQRTVVRRRTHLQQKWLCLTEALTAELPWTIPFPAGGVSVWIAGPPELDARDLVAECLRRGVVIEGGDAFFLDPKGSRNHFRLGFSVIGLGKIPAGVKELRLALESLLGSPLNS